MRCEAGTHEEALVTLGFREAEGLAMAVAVGWKGAECGSGVDGSPILLGEGKELVVARSDPCRTSLVLGG